jgi:arachidonate 15-lipoxygenase
MTILPWALRRRVWNAQVLLKFRQNEPATIGVPPEDAPLRPVPLSERVPGIRIDEILVADRIPPGEDDRKRERFYRLQVALYRRLPAMQPGLPPVDADRRVELERAYTPAHRRLFPAPTRPESLDPLDLGDLAVASPFACYLRRTDQGYEWDLDLFDGAELHPGLVPLGSRVSFEVDESTRRLRAVAIDCELGRCRPDDGEWERAQRIATCAANNHMALVRHYCWVHLTFGAALSIATRNELPTAHPLRRFLWPHVYGTELSNHVTALGQLSKGGDFESIFSFTHRGVCALMEAAYLAYDSSVVNPRLDGERRGIADGAIDTPVLDSHTAIYDVLRAHAARYLAAYYANDDALRADAAVTAWLAALDRLVPNGATTTLAGDRGIAGVADLLGACLFLAAVQHDVVGTGLWQYQLWTDAIPVRIYADGRAEPVDVYQRLVNSAFLLNVTRAPLMQDFRHLALDPAGAEAFAAFQRDLEALQRRFDEDPPAPWRLEPKQLEANINA